MPEAPWRRRFRAPQLSRPEWAEEAPGRLIYSSNEIGKTELYAWSLETDEHHRLTDRPEGTRGGAIDPTGEWVWWFDDNRGSELGHWVRQRFDSTNESPVIERIATDLSPAYSTGLALGRKQALIGRSIDEGASIYLVNLNLSGDQKAGEPRLLYSHLEDAELGELSADERLFSIMHSEHGDSRHPALRVLTTEGEALAELFDGPGRGLWSRGWSPVKGDNRLIILQERGDLPRPLVWSPLTGQERELKLDLPGEIEADWYPDGKSLLLLHDYRGRVEAYRYVLEEDRLIRLESERGVITSARVRPNGELWYAWERSDEPPLILGENRIVLANPGEAAPKGVAYSDDEAEGVHYFLAEPKSPRPHPTIFYIHGGPTWHDADDFTPSVQAFVDHGFAVVMPNYRGSTGYGKAWRDALEGNPGLTELEDIALVYDRVIQRGIADPNRMILGGNSWGGYITLLGLGVQPKRWAAGLAGVPVADYVAAYEDEMEPLKAFDRALFGASPYDAPAVYNDRSPLTFIGNVKAPVIILAGMNDPRCPIRQIENYVSRLDELGLPYEVYRFEAGHGSARVEESIHQVEIRLSFLAKNLGTPEPL